jgi:coenzyme F420-dependent glucose-6-phosphate dehydrogenase
MEIGFALSSEEHGPLELIRLAARAEAAGFSFAMISDHFHPWTDHQGNSPFVWSVLGGIAQATSRIRVGTSVTCPTVRIHPAIIAQAAATTALMFEGRFFLGVGSGENLNEHILGVGWPPVTIRLEMLEEAVQVIRTLWTGGLQNHRGTYYRVENAKIYNLPPQPPAIFVAAGGKKAAALAGRIGDGLISVSPDRLTVDVFTAAGGGSKGKLGQAKVCYAPSEAAAVKTVLEWWPTVGVAGPLNSELPLPSHFEAAARGITEQEVSRLVVCGPDPERHVAEVRKFVDAGFDQVYIHQIGRDQEGFFHFYEKELRPRLSGLLQQDGARRC